MFEYPYEFARRVRKIVKLEESGGQVRSREICQVLFRVQRDRLARRGDGLLKSPELDERGGHADQMRGLRRLCLRSGQVLFQSLFRLSLQIKLGQLSAQIGAVRLGLD